MSASNKGDISKPTRAFLRQAKCAATPSHLLSSAYSLSSSQSLPEGLACKVEVVRARVLHRLGNPKEAAAAFAAGLPRLANAHGARSIDYGFASNRGLRAYRC